MVVPPNRRAEIAAFKHLVRFMMTSVNGLNVQISGLSFSEVSFV
jgi:hypothetical protein